MDFTAPGILALAAVPAVALAAGFGALCVCVLYALHHLRTQPPKRETATLLFWQLAVRSTRTQVPWSTRFTHRRTFLLLASILLLLAASLIADRWTTEGSRDMIVIDAGEETAAPTTGNRNFLRDLADAAATDLTHLNASPGLVVAGPLPLMQLAPGQPKAITNRALEKLSPRPGASASSLALQEAGLAIGGKAGRIFWYTSAASIPDELPDDLRQRIVLRQITAPLQMVISGVTFVPAPDGNARGTLRVQLAGSPASGVTLRAEVQGGPSTQLPVKMSGNGQEVSFENWPANGQPVSLTLLNAPGASATHMVAYHAPDCRPPVFQFSSGIAAALKLALLSVGVEATGADDPKVIFVAQQGMAIPPRAIACILINNQGKGVTVGVPLRLVELPLLRGIDLEGAVAGEGPALSQSGASVLTAGPWTLAGLNLSGRLPTLTLSGSLVSSTANLPRHAAFPMLMERLCDALIGRSNAPVVIPRSRLASDPLWIGPPQMPPINRQAVPDPPSLPLAPGAWPAMQRDRWSPPWSDLILAGAIALLIVESLLYAARRTV